MNLANKITIFRIFLIPIFVLVMVIPTDFIAYQNFIAAIIFIVAAATDGIDGYIARNYNQITTLGKFLDPLADKLLTMAAFVCLVSINEASAWIVILILAREFAVTGLRTLAVRANIVVAASSLGKIKTVTQMLAIIVILISTFPPLLNIFPDPILFWVGQILLYIALFFTLLSGIDYFIKCKAVFKEPLS